jgi:hypothetical protein
VLGEVGADTAQAVLDDFGDGFATHCGVEARTFTVSAEQPRIGWRRSASAYDRQ